MLHTALSTHIDALGLAGAHFLRVPANPALLDGLQGLLTDQCCLKRCGQPSVNLHTMTSQCLASNSRSPAIELLQLHLQEAQCREQCCMQKLEPDA